jgi:hypothetical protein
VALTIKEAQSYGVNVKENSSAAFDYPYGVYFNVGTGGNNSTFILFIDSIKNNLYDYVNFATCPTDSECLQKYSMTKGTGIKSICAGVDENNCIDTTKLSILFKRPSLEANIYAYDSGGSQILTLSQLPPYVRIVLSAQNGTATSTVVVTSVGQIYIKK